MSKAKLKQAGDGGVFTPLLPDELPRAGSRLAEARAAVDDVQRLRSLVNILNMRIELLESELARYRTSSSGDQP